MEAILYVNNPDSTHNMFFFALFFVACLWKVLSLPQLSERGVKHLDADVKYLSNVFHALDLPAPPILEHLSLLAALDRDHAVAHLAQETVTGENKKAVHLKARVSLEKRVENRGSSVGLRIVVSLRSYCCSRRPRIVSGTKSSS